MGSGSYDPGVFRAFTKSNTGKSTKDIYTSRNLHASLNPHSVKIRESRDSADNPNSTPVIVALDVTGSMGILAQEIATKGLNTLFASIIDRKPITDPHVMFMAVGDVHYDQAPLQVSQFEADKRIIEQLTQIFVEGGGGGNMSESYNLPWWFAAFHTEHDSIEKRGKRGYLFTVGDEEVPPDLTANQLDRVLGGSHETGMSNDDLLAAVQRKYDVYHIVILEGHHALHYRNRTIKAWQERLGQHTILLEDHTALAETIVSTMQVAEGADIDSTASSWGSGLKTVVHNAIKTLPSGTNRPMLGGPA